MQRYRIIIAIVLVVAVFMPLPAHAGILDTFISMSTNGIVRTINAVLDILRQGLTDAIAWMGGVLQSVLNLPMSYGGATVYQMWRWLRDLCNMLFIVVMVVISFATIFNVFIRNNPFYWRPALISLVVAATTINISMAVGQTIMWSGNKLGTLVLQAMGGGTNAAAQIIVSLNVDKVIQLGKTTPAALLPPLSTVPTEQITQAQKAMLDGWKGRAQGGNQASLTALQHLEGCLKRNGTIDQCFTEAYRFASNSTLSELDKLKADSSLAGQAVQTADRIYATIAGVAKDLGSVRAGSSDSLNVTMSSLVSLFVLLVTALSLFSIILFSVAKIPAMWFLLAVSAPAFFAIAIPSARKTFDTWLKNVIGWSLFAPLYLMVIYIGLFMLKTQGSLVTGITGSTSDLPFLSGLLGTAFFAIVAAFVFTGGALAVFRLCFSLSPSAGQWFNAIGGRLGVSEKTGFGVSTVASRLGALTGTTALYQAGQARLQQGREDVSAALRRRLPTLMRSEEETLALRKAQMGVRGAGEEYAKLTRKHIEEQTAILAAPQKRKLQALEADLLDPKKTQEQRNAISGQIKKLKEDNVTDLRKRMGSGNREAALAAGELLMADGKLSPDEFRTLAQKYSQIGPDALAGFVKRRDEQLMKDVKEKKFTKGAEPKEMAEYLSLIGDAKQANAYIEAAKKGKNKFWALEAGARLNLIMGPDGQPMTTDQVVAKEAPQFNAGDIVNMEAYYKGRGDPIPEGAKIHFERGLLNPETFSKMLQATANDKEQAKRLTAASDAIRVEVRNLQAQEKELNKDVDENLKKAREAETEKRGDATGAQLYRSNAQGIQGRLTPIQNRLQALKRKQQNEQKKQQDKKKGEKEEKKEKPTEPPPKPPTP